MVDDLSKGRVDVVVRVGSRPPPGFLWNVKLFRAAEDSARSLLTPAQYDHMAEQVQDLARHEDPSHSDALDLRSIEDFLELRDKGGVLQKMNVRLFYFAHKPSRTIVVLHAIKKENNGPTPDHDRITARRRKRIYLKSFCP